jgi:hypothetical protein
VSVQCDIITELSDEAWESKRDSVEVVSCEGTRLVYHPDLQHNKNFSDLRANCLKIVADTLQALQLGGGGAGASSPSSESEASARESGESSDDDAAEGGRAVPLPEQLQNGRAVPLQEAVQLLRAYYSSKYGGGAAQ